MIDCRIWFKPEPEVLSPSWTHNTVYVVGSEEEHFICDRVYFDLEAAKAYCDEQDKRDYPKLRWSVMAAPIGGDWLQWEHVYPRAK
jgi:hypothetical protein